MSNTNFMLMPNQYYYLINKALYASPYLNLFWNYNSNNSTFISLNYDRVRINIHDKISLPLAAWYGAKFNHNIDTIECGPVKLRPEADNGEEIISMCFNDTYSLDINWEIRGNLKTFKSEEFKTDKIKIDIDGIKYYPARYIHSTYLIDKGCFNHLDGAIHFYTEEEYYKRRNSDLNYNHKNFEQIKSRTEKLFKINGKIDTQTWSNFISMFFSGNPLIIEYFTGEYPSDTEKLIELYKNKKRS